MKKMLPWIITILLAITLIAVVAMLLYNNILGPSDGTSATNAEQTVNDVETQKYDAAEILEMSSEIRDIKTNLLDPSYIVMMNLSFQLDSADTKEEFEQIKELVFRPIIINQLGDMNPEELNGSAGRDALTAKLLTLMNERLKQVSEGKLLKVNITDVLVTQI